MALAMIDIDLFKIYNDTHGHLAGDKVLKQVATKLKAMLRRDDDFFFRVGGEEFAAIFTAKDYEGMKQMADKLVEAVQALELELPESAVQEMKTVTISLGALYSDCQDVSSPETLYAEADKLLYIAKENGRNQAFFDRI